jgi:hypothetical protein
MSRAGCTPGLVECVNTGSFGDPSLLLLHTLQLILDGVQLLLPLHVLRG